MLVSCFSEIVPASLCQDSGILVDIFVVNLCFKRHSGSRAFGEGLHVKSINTELYYSTQLCTVDFFSDFSLRISVCSSVCNHVSLLWIVFSSLVVNHNVSLPLTPVSYYPLIVLVFLVLVAKHQCLLPVLYQAVIYMF